MSTDLVGAMTRAATHLDAAAQFAERGMALEMPRVFRRGAARERMAGEFSTAIEHARRALRELDGAGAPLEDARAGIRTSIEWIAPARHPDIASARRLEDVRTSAARFGLQRDALQLRAQLAGRSAEEARATLQVEVDAIIDQPAASVTTAQLRRLAMLRALPEDVRPAFPRPVRDWNGFEQLVAKGWDGSERMVAAELHNLRLDRARRAVAADPAATRAAHEAELRTILARPHDDLVQADLDRISVLAGLGADLRPRYVDAPDPWPRPNLPLDQVGAWRYGFRPSDGQVKARLDSVRMAIDHERMLTDPSVTRESVSREVAAILSTPREQLDITAMRRLGTLLHLPEHLRPPLPPALDSHWRVENLGLLNAVPTRHMAAERIYHAGRLELLADTDPGVLVREVRARVESGSAVDLNVVNALAARDPNLLEQAGISEELLRDQAISALAAGTNVTGRDVADHLAFTRTGLVQLDIADEVQRTVRDQVLELIDTNLARIRGHRRDTFGTHPDYAEVGRIAENARLLHLLAGAAPSAPPRSSAAEVLPW